MNITRTSLLTGKESTFDLNVTKEQMDEFDSPNRREIQYIFPNISSSEREFIKTGYTDDDWLSMFGEEEI